MTIKRIILIGIIVFLAVLPFVTYYFRGNPREIPEPERDGLVVYVEDYVERQDELINEEVEKLKKQSLDETFVYLLDDQKYLYPGYQTEALFVPMDMQRILSARGVLKVFQQFDVLPREQAIEKLHEFCERAIKGFEASLENSVERNANPSLFPNPTSLTVMGAKYTVCTTMLLAARMGEHKLLLNQIDKMQPLIDAYVDKVEVYYPPEFVLLGAAREIASLEHDCILTVLMYASKRAGIELKDIPLDTFEKIAIPLCRWDAKLTYYDREIQRQLVTLNHKDVVEEFDIYEFALRGAFDAQTKKLIDQKQQLVINTLKERLSK